MYLNIATVGLLYLMPALFKLLCQFSELVRLCDGDEGYFTMIFVWKACQYEIGNLCLYYKIST